MSNAGKLVKSLLKAKKESVMGKLGDSPYEDPLELQLTKNVQSVKEETLSEDSLLMKYISSLGFNPEFMSFAQRSSYARSNAFKRYKVGHDYEAGKDDLKREEVEQIDEAGTGLLMTFIKSKGLNPLMMDGNQKRAYSRSSEFRMFKMRHMKETSGMGERGDNYSEGKKIKKQGVAEATGNKPFDNMMKIIKKGTAKQATADRKAEKEKSQQRARDAFGPNPAAGLGIRKPSVKVNELKRQDDNMELDDRLTREDLRKWFSKTNPEGDWKRINSKGEVAGPCAREPGEPKPKCMSKKTRSELSKSERASAVATKRKHDPVADRAGKGGSPVNVSNYGKGKLSNEEIEEAANAAQQAAIAIAMKKAGKKPKNDVSEAEARIPRKSGQPANSDKHSDLYTDENPKGTIHGLKFATSVDAKNSVKKIRASSRSHAHKIQAAIAMEQRAKVMGKRDAASVYRTYINSVKKVDEACWDTHKQVGMKKKGNRMVPDCRPKNEETDAVSSLESSLRKPTSYDAIDQMMQTIAKKGGITPKELHTNFVKKHGKTPDDYANKEVVQEGIGGIEDSPLSATNSVKAMESEHRKKNMKSARIIKSIYKKKNVKETMYDWEKTDKGTSANNAKITMQGGTTMTGKPRDTVEIEPMLRTRPNSQKP